MLKFKNKNGFTFIEILIVISIIVILLGMLLTAAARARQQARINQAQAMIASLETALAMFHVDFGEYPPTDNQNLVNALAHGAPAGFDPANWNGPYMSFKQDDLNDAIPNAVLRDPWGSNYVYTRIDGPPQTYIIASPGPDKTPGTGDDITNQ